MNVRCILLPINYQSTTRATRPSIDKHINYGENRVSSGTVRPHSSPSCLQLCAQYKQHDRDQLSYIKLLVHKASHCKRQIKYVHTSPNQFICLATSFTIHCFDSFVDLNCCYCIAFLHLSMNCHDIHHLFLPRCIDYLIRDIHLKGETM